MKKRVKRFRKYWAHLIVFLILLILLFVLISKQVSENNVAQQREKQQSAIVSVTIAEENAMEPDYKEGVEG